MGKVLQLSDNLSVRKIKCLGDTFYEITFNGKTHIRRSARCILSMFKHFKKYEKKYIREIEKLQC